MDDVKKILGALVLSVICGVATPMLPAYYVPYVVGVYGFFGTLFLNALKCVIIPLVASSIISGVAGIGATKDLGSMGLKTFLYYTATSLLAVLTGVILVNVIAPGMVGDRSLREFIHLDEGTKLIEQVGNADLSSVFNVFLEMVPPNIFSAAANGQMLGIISFSLIFGAFIPRIGHEYSDVLYKVFTGVHEIMMAITRLIMRFAPVGIFALVAKVVTEAGVENAVVLFKGLGLFFVTVVAGLFIHVFFTLSLVIYRVARRDPKTHMGHMAPALITAFSTASSSATLPMTMECLEKRAGVSERVTGFVTPLGATINMDGTALYECVSALFIAQALGVQMGLLDQVIVVWVALITSIGVAGIPAASLVAIAVILKSVGLPVEAMAIILPVDRFLDMLRTAVNVFSDSVGALFLEKMTSRSRSI